MNEKKQNTTKKTVKVINKEDQCIQQDESSALSCVLEKTEKGKRGQRWCD